MAKRTESKATSDAQSTIVALTPSRTPVPTATGPTRTPSPIDKGETVLQGGMYVSTAWVAAFTLTSNHSLHSSSVSVGRRMAHALPLPPALLTKRVACRALVGNPACTSTRQGGTAPMFKLLSEFQTPILTTLHGRQMENSSLIITVVVWALSDLMGLADELSWSLVVHGAHLCLHGRPIVNGLQCYLAYATQQPKLLIRPLASGSSVETVVTGGESSTLNIH